MTKLSNYSTTAADNNDTPPDGWPEGMLPSDVNNTARQNYADLATWYQDAQWIDFGDTPTQTSATTFTVATDLTARYVVSRRIKMFGTTLGTLYGTITASSFSSPNTTVTVVVDDGTSLTSNLSRVEVGIIDPTNTALPLTLPRGYIGGLNTSTDTDSDHDILISVGDAKDSTNAVSMLLATAITKQIDANWAEGDDAGGFPSGLTLTADTAYHIFIISKTDGTVDAGFDTSLTAANLLTDASAYTYFRRIFTIVTDSGPNIRDYFQWGDECLYLDPPLDLSAQSITTTASTHALSVPLGIKVRANINASNTVAGNNANVYISSPDVNDEAPSSTAAPLSNLRSDSIGSRTNQNMFVMTNTSAEVRIRSDLTTDVWIAVMGWTDRRGQDD